MQFTLLRITTDPSEGYKIHSGIKDIKTHLIEPIRVKIAIWTVEIMAIQCSKCGYIGRYKSEVKLHESTVHSEARPFIWQFPGCSFRTKSKICLKGHGRIHETKLELRKPFPCDFPDCEYRADRQYALRLHIAARHTPGKTKDFQCALCASKFYFEQGLKRHIACHVKEGRFTCEHCDFITHDRKCMLGHVRAFRNKSVTSYCSFPCCRYSSTYHPAVRRHFRGMHSSHPDPLLRLPVACSFPGCGYRADYAGTVRKHVNIHHNPQRRPEHACPLCPKTFYRENSLLGHINGVHTMEKSYRCPKCDYASPYEGNVLRHNKTVHEKKKRPRKWVACELCAYRTCFKESLSVHVMTTHTSHRRFQCEQADCHFKTNVAQVLKKHLLLHEQDPERQFPIVCRVPGCDFRRRSTGEMNVHERIHETSKAQFKCKICPAKFSYPDKNSLLFHNYLRHKQIPFKCSE